jgi:hypothetical protein
MTRGQVGLLAALAAAGCSGGAGIDREREATLSPPTASFTVRAGATVTEAKTVDLPAKPPKADIEIAIDTTGSMGPSIAQAKVDATNIVNGVQGSVPDTHFAVVQFRDSGDTPEYQLLTPMTSSASDVQTAINGLSAGGGGDAPEEYNLVFDKSFSDGAVGWRADARKFVIVIGDAQPHGDLASQGFTGCSNVSADPEGLNTTIELGRMNVNQRTLMMIFQPGPFASTNVTCYQSLAASAFSGGQAVTAMGSLATQIVSLIDAAFANVSDLHLEVVSGPASWIVFAPPALGPIPAPSTQSFTLTATVPPGTAAGTYSFDIEAVADGADVGHQLLDLIVPPKMLTLTPATASRPIGTTHTVLAHVFDVIGPFVGDAVGFAVAGVAASPSSGGGTTDVNGNAPFSFTNAPPNPGTDTITASDGALLATAQIVWFDQPPDCSKVALDTTLLWPPNHKLHTITASGATDPDVGDSATLVIDGVTQDEPTNGLGDGDTAIDAFLSSPLSNQAQIRSERSGLGDGRVYRVHYTATDTHGLSCSGTATVGVPHDHNSTPIDSAPPSYDSTL